MRLLFLCCCVTNMLSAIAWLFLEQYAKSWERATRGLVFLGIAAILKEREGGT